MLNLSKWPTTVGQQFEIFLDYFTVFFSKVCYKIGCFSFGWSVIFSILLQGNVHSQAQQFSIYDFGDRLSKDLIKDIETDSYGYIWTATDQGVVRYDGQRAVFYKGEIPGGYAKGLLRTSDGRLLVLHDFGLTEIIIEPDTVFFKTLLEGKPDDSEDGLHYPKTIYEDRKGQIWIGENQSVVLYNKGSFKKYRFRNNQNFGVITRSFSFTEDDQGSLWVFSHSGFLFRFDEVRDMFIEYQLSQKISEVNFVIQRTNGKCWVGAKDGIFQMKLDTDQQTISIEKLGGPTASSCALLVEDIGFIVGTWNNGLYFNSGKVGDSAFRKIDDFPFMDIVGLCYDEKNGFWVTGHEHSVLLKSVFFENYNFKTKNRPSITSLNKSQDGSLLVIADENEINKQEIYELKNGQIIWKLGLPVNPFDNIPLAAFDDGKNIWVGDLGGYVYYFDKEKKIPQKINKIQSSNSPISSIAKDQNNNIWIAGNIHHGLIKITPDLNIEFYNTKGLNNAKVIYPAPNGQLYVGGGGADNYLFKFNEVNNKFENISYRTELNLNENFEVKDMVLSANGTMFLATTDGVFKTSINNENKTSFEHLNLNKVPLSEPCNALAFSPDSMLWVSTTSGLLAIDQHSSFLFDKSSGLPANSFTNNGLILDESGNLWIGTASGLSLYQHKWSDFPLTPTPIIERVNVNSKKQKLVVNNDQLIPFNAGIEINFISLSFPADQVVYKTRILEIDTTWSVPELKKQSYFAGLNAGKYTFQVVAQQQEGMRWSLPASYSFEIEKPWYQKTWVIIVLTAFLFTLVSVAARIYNLRLIKQKKDLEAIIEKRTQEINKQKNEIIEQQNKLLEQNETMRKLKEEQYKKDLENKNKQLTTYTLNLIQKNQALKTLQLEINQVIRSSSKSSYQEMRKLLNLIDYSFRKDEDWENFKLFFEEVYVGFFANLIQRHPRLTSHDLRHCALIRLNLTIEEIATIIGISADSIKTARFRLKKKMELDSKVDLLEYLMSV
ncbi:MAG: hypothetical protein R2825_13960 [Saprospiraceae bacterium]